MSQAKPILQHIVETAGTLKPKKIHVVVGHKGDQVIQCIAQSVDSRIFKQISWVEQSQQKGTGHAVMTALPFVGARSDVMILNGDIPLITSKTLRKIAKSSDRLNLLTVNLQDPTGLGRIIRNDKGKVTAIVEERDASRDQKLITEINTNCLCAQAKKLNKWLWSTNCKNAQNEYYLTDAIACAVADGTPIHTVNPGHIRETLGVNTRKELSILERSYQQLMAERLMDSGVTLIDPSRIDVRGTCKFGNDCLVDINVIFEGDVKIGNNVTIGPHTVIRNATIGDGCVIEANSVIDQARIGKQCQIGPFARIRPDTVLRDNVKIGNFVETKNSTVAAGSKVNHLSYVGDSKVGKDVNVGAGVITCNYDGANKHQTVIGNNVFIGSDCQLVAPVEIADGATVGAGSTITDNVRKNALAVSRTRQRQIDGWKRPQKKS